MNFRKKKVVPTIRQLTFKGIVRNKKGCRILFFGSSYNTIKMNIKIKSNRKCSYECKRKKEITEQ